MEGHKYIEVVLAEEFHTEALQIADAMEQRGGGFVQALSHAIRNADIINKGKIRKAWPELWEEYRQHAIHIQRLENHNGTRN